MTQTNARAKTIFNVTFPSGAEADRYLVLRDLLERGTITDLKVAALDEVPTFRLIPAFVELDGTKHQEIGYTPDFMYRYSDPGMPELHQGRVWHVEEVKGRIFKDYPLRKKLFLFYYGRHYVFHELRSGGRRRRSR
jgi:hypothetical protein